MADTYNTTIDQGADWYLTLYYKDSAGAPVNLTGYTSSMQFRTAPESAVAILSLSTGSGITITGSEGKIAIHATAAQTGAITAGNYVYDLEITSSGGIVTRLIEGKVYFDPEVTRG